MKRFTFFSMSLLILLAFSTACETTSSDSDAAESEAVTEDVSSSPAEDMSLTEEAGPQELAATEACKRIRAFQNQPTTAEFPTGFTLSTGDITALLAYDDYEDSIFAMIGYHADLAVAKNIEKFELIFCLKKKDAEGYDYFDFTKPCPNYCPTGLSGDNPPTIADLDGNDGYWFKRSGIGSGLGGTEGDVVLALDRGQWSNDISLQDCNSGDCETKWLFQDCGGAFPPACSPICAGVN